MECTVWCTEWGLVDWEMYSTMYRMRSGTELQMFWNTTVAGQWLKQDCPGISRTVDKYAILFIHLSYVLLSINCRSFALSMRLSYVLHL